MGCSALCPLRRSRCAFALACVSTRCTCARLPGGGVCGGGGEGEDTGRQRVRTPVCGANEYPFAALVIVHLMPVGLPTMRSSAAALVKLPPNTANARGCKSYETGDAIVTDGGAHHARTQGARVQPPERAAGHERVRARTLPVRVRTHGHCFAWAPGTFAWGGGLACGARGRRVRGWGDTAQADRAWRETAGRRSKAAHVPEMRTTSVE